jgi:hypothetical protein
MQPDSLQDGHFLGLQRVSTFSPHFSQVKTAIKITSKRKDYRLQHSIQMLDVVSIICRD